ncbi:hypothetical protein AGMMS49983_00140 [Clostridia bacterium]|nr:hypothetical protein AGMMS49983_00140 [Clostridia bacterium]
MEKIIIDCDPGHDDAIELLLAVTTGKRTGKVDLIGVTTVAGNSEGEHTVKNALKVLNFAGIQDIPVYAGCSQPMMRKLYRLTGELIHGSDGLGGPVLPEPVQQPEEMHAVDYLIKTLRSAAEKITVITSGPLTNLAAAFVLAPDIKKNINRIISMGGAVLDPGNITSAAEFNIYVDPEAAKIVFDSGCEIYLNTLDVTMKALISKPEIDELVHSPQKLQRLIGEFLTFFEHTHEEHFGISACPVHDALNVAILIDPDIVKFQHVFLDVSTHDELTVGETVADLWGITGKAPNVHISIEVDSTKFIRMIKEIQ